MKNLQRILRKNFDLLLLPLAFLIWWQSSLFTRWLDPTAGVDDAGFIQHILLKIVAFLIITIIVRLYMRYCWKAVDTYLRHNFSDDFRAVDATTRLWISALIFGVITITLAIL